MNERNDSTKQTQLSAPTCSRYLTDPHILRQWLLSWPGRMGALKEIWVCVNFLLSMCEDGAGTTNTHRICPAFLSVGVKFPSEAPTSNFPHRRLPQSRSHHCLPVNRDRVLFGKQSEVGRCWCCPHFGGSVAPRPLTVCWQLPGNGNSKWLSETA